MTKFIISIQAFWTELIIPEFIKSQISWTAFSSIVVAGTLYYTITKDRKEHKKSIENIKRALVYELITNINLLFSPEPERRPLFDVICTIRKDFVKFIKNEEAFFKIQKLYSELDYYQMFIMNNFGKVKSSEIEKKQCQIMNAFLRYFNADTITEGASEEGITKARNKGVDLKDKKISCWEKQLENDINLLF